MKLEIHNPKNYIDQTFDSHVMSENSSLEVLKSEGLNFATQEGSEDVDWVSEVVMGNKPLKSAKKWYLYLQNGSFLSIE